jgi:hypothetical protein
MITLFHLFIVPVFLDRVVQQPHSRLLWHSVSCMRAYVQFRGSEFHTRNALFRQLQEQRRAKAHSRQAKECSIINFPFYL